MTLNKLCPNFRKEWRRKRKAHWKAVTTELAWREHERAQGIRPKGSFIEAVRELEAQFSA